MTQEEYEAQIESDQLQTAAFPRTIAEKAGCFALLILALWSVYCAVIHTASLIWEATK